MKKKRRHYTGVRIIDEFMLWLVGYVIFIGFCMALEIDAFVKETVMDERLSKWLASIAVDSIVLAFIVATGGGLVLLLTLWIGDLVKSKVIKLESDTPERQSHEHEPEQKLETKEHNMLGRIAFALFIVQCAVMAMVLAMSLTMFKMNELGLMAKWPEKWLYGSSILLPVVLLIRVGFYQLCDYIVEKEKKNVIKE